MSVGKIVVPIIAFVIIIAGVWVYNGPKKEVIAIIEWETDDTQKQRVPIFSVHYKWDGQIEDSKWWVIISDKNNKWWVIDCEIGNHNEFSYQWIHNDKFIPSASRYETLLTLVGFRPIYWDEKKAFSKILKGIEEYNKGTLKEIRYDKHLF